VTTTAPLAHKPVPPVNYAMALLGLVLGTVTAIVALPSDYYEPGGLTFSALLLAAGLLTGPFVSSLTDPRGWLRAESVMMLGLVYWLLTELLSTDYEAYQLTRDGIIRAFVYIGLFAAMIQLGSAIAHRWHAEFFKPRPSPPDFSADWLFNALMACSLLGLLARVIPCEFSPECLSEGLFGARQMGAWTRGMKGDSGAFVQHLGYFGYLSLPLTVALHYRVRRIDWRVAAGLVLTVIFMLFLIKDGGRRLVGMVAGSGLLTWLLLRPRLNLRELVIGGGAGLLLLALMEVMLMFRLSSGGVLENLFSGRAFESNPLEEGVKVDNNFNSLVRTLDLIPQFEPFTGWDSVVYWAVRPIPRVLWPEKPINPGVDIPTALGKNWGPGFSLTLSAVGDWYIGFGIWSIALAGLGMGFLGGRLVLAWFKPTLRQTMLYSLGAMCLFIGLRSYLELILMSYPILALLLIERLTQMRNARLHAVAQPRIS